MPFVPTPAAFFSAAGGVVIRRTFSAGAGRRGLESAAQFSTGCIVIGGTVCRAASFIQVVILHTISGSRHWNPPHSLRRAGLLSAAQFRCGVHHGAKKMVVIGRTIRTFFCGRQVVIHSTILYTAFFIRFPTCVSANSPGKYNLAGKILSASPSKKFSSSPLLSSAHFQNLKNPFHFSPPTIAQQKYFFSAIYAVNNNRGPLLLSAAQFQIACLPYAKSFAAPSDCYSAHILPHSPHFVPK